MVLILIHYTSIRIRYSPPFEVYWLAQKIFGDAVFFAHVNLGGLFLTLAGAGVGISLIFSAQGEMLFLRD